MGIPASLKAKWDQFREVGQRLSRPRLSRAAAAVFPTFGRLARNAQKWQTLAREAQNAFAPQPPSAGVEPTESPQGGNASVPPPLPSPPSQGGGKSAVDVLESIREFLHPLPGTLEQIRASLGKMGGGNTPLPDPADKRKDKTPPLVSALADVSPTFAHIHDRAKKWTKLANEVHSALFGKPRKKRQRTGKNASVPPPLQRVARPPKRPKPPPLPPTQATAPKPPPVPKPPQAAKADARLPRPRPSTPSKRTKQIYIPPRVRHRNRAMDQSDVEYHRYRRTIDDRQLRGMREALGLPVSKTKVTPQTVKPPVSVSRETPTPITPPSAPVRPIASGSALAQPPLTPIPRSNPDLGGTSPGGARPITGMSSQGSNDDNSLVGVMRDILNEVRSARLALERGGESNLISEEGVKVPGGAGQRGVSMWTENKAHEPTKPNTDPKEHSGTDLGQIATLASGLRAVGSLVTGS